MLGMGKSVLGGGGSDRGQSGARGHQARSPSHVLDAKQREKNADKT